MVYSNVLATHPNSVQEQNVASSGYVRWIIVMVIPSEVLICLLYGLVVLSNGSPGVDMSALWPGGDIEWFTRC